MTPYFREQLGCEGATAPATPAQAQQSGEPVAWRWRNCVGDWVTGWLDYKPSQRACIEQQVTEAGGIIQYAYATTPPAPAQPAQQQAGDVVRYAERYRWRAAHRRRIGEHWGGRWSIVIDGPVPKTHDSEDDFDAAIDTAMASSARNGE